MSSMPRTTARRFKFFDLGHERASRSQWDESFGLKSEARSAARENLRAHLRPGRLISSHEGAKCLYRNSRVRSCTVRDMYKEAAALHLQMYEWHLQGVCEILLAVPCKVQVVSRQKLNSNRENIVLYSININVFSIASKFLTPNDLDSAFDSESSYKY